MTDTHLNAETIYESYLSLGIEPPYEIRLAYLTQRIIEDAPNIAYGQVVDPETGETTGIIAGLNGVGSQVPQVRVDDGRWITGNQFSTESVPNMTTATYILPDETFWAVDANTGLHTLNEDAFNTYLSNVHGADCDGLLRMAMFMANYDDTYDRSIYNRSGAQNLYNALRTCEQGMCFNADQIAISELVVGDVIYFSHPSPHVAMVSAITEEGPVISESTIDPLDPTLTGPMTRHIPPQYLSSDGTRFADASFTVYRSNPQANQAAHATVVAQAKAMELIRNNEVLAAFATDEALLNDVLGLDGTDIGVGADGADLGYQDIAALSQQLQQPEMANAIAQVQALVSTTGFVDTNIDGLLGGVSLPAQSPPHGGRVH